MAAFTQTDLDELEKAIATGSRRVKYEDREVEYRSIREMRSLVRELRRELGVDNTDGRKFHRATTNRGLA